MKLDAIYPPADLLLATDFFRHLHGLNLRVFLCGSRLADDEVKDFRRQVQRLLENHMGCSCFLGEDVAGISIGSKTNGERDYVEIEVEEAEGSELIIVFLGSVGTVAELTAFALSPKTKSKLVVFNNRQYKDVSSFVNKGPLRKLNQEQIVYYPPETPTDRHILRALDLAVARAWYGKMYDRDKIASNLGFNEHLTLSYIFACHPIRYVDLKKLIPTGEAILRKSLHTLFQEELIEETENKYIPRLRPDDFLRGAALRNLMSCRAKALSFRLQDDESISDYRLML